MKKGLIIVLGIIICVFGVFNFSRKATSKNIPDSAMNNILVNEDKIIKPDPELENVYNYHYHVDNKKRIVYIIPRDPNQLKNEMDDLRTTPVGTSNLNDKTKSEKQFTLVSKQIAQRYGKAWKVQVTNTYDPIFDDMRKSDILWEFQNGKEKGHGTQGGLFKLERILLTPFDYLFGLIGLIILGALGKGALSIVGAADSTGGSGRPYRATEIPDQPNYGYSDYYEEKSYYDQDGNAHHITFKNGDYSSGQEFGREFRRNSDGGYDSNDGSDIHLDKDN